MPQRVDLMIQKFQKAEHIFVPPYEDKTATISLERFVLKNFQIPNDDLERICKFISQDSGVEKIIFQLPELIQNEVSYDKLQISFCEEFQNEFLQLEISIFTSMEISDCLKIEDRLEQQLYELFDWDSADKVLLVMR